jgi:nitroreductase
MEFNEILVNRRAIRNYENKAVSLSTIEEILHDATLAPTARNLQPCRFIIIRNRDFMKRISDDCKKNLLSDILHDPGSPLKDYESRFSDEQYHIFHNAPCVVYVIGPAEARLIDVDCALTAAYILFSATARGLGTCWIGLGVNIRDQEILDEMGMPPDCRIIAPIVIGYPEEIPPASERHEPVIVKII